jgi:hypothetical protein
MQKTQVVCPTSALLDLDLKKDRGIKQLPWHVIGEHRVQCQESARMVRALRDLIGSSLTTRATRSSPPVG